MERLSKKLRGERGASLILALLMFLVCVLVSATVLAAAASNAGKYRSNQSEQQKYLVLSSAIRLVAEEIEKAEYTGKYAIYEWDETDVDGNVIGSYYHIEQVRGIFDCGDLGSQGKAGIADDTPIQLLGELDAIFNEQFKKNDGTGDYKIGYGAEFGLVLEAPPAAPRKLTVTVDGLPADVGPDIYKVPREATVQVKLDHATRHITLTAWLGTDDFADATDFMSAELVARGVPAISYTPGLKTAESPSSGSAVRTETTSAMKWELKWIKKGAA